jgi:putative flavoprotein involved in K+ transport
MLPTPAELEANSSSDRDLLEEEHGVRIVGRMIGASGHRAYFSDDLADAIGHADRKMHEMLDRIDWHISRLRWTSACPVEPRPRAVAVPMAPRAVNLRDSGVDTVVWATGYRREYPWLHIPVLDEKGEIIHRGGVTACPGLYVLGLHLMRRRNSAFLDGVGADAADLANHHHSTQGPPLCGCGVEPCHARRPWNPSPTPEAAMMPWWWELA